MFKERNITNQQNDQILFTPGLLPGGVVVRNFGKEKPAGSWIWRV